MNRAQKIAWSLVIAISLGFVVSCIAVAILYAKVGMPKALLGFGSMGIAGLGAFSPLIFKKDKGKVTFDERDRLIKRNAALAGFGASYLFMGAACMIPFYVLGPNGVISVRWLPYIFVGAAISSFFVHSVTILAQYGRRNKNYE
jgi:predicted membrane channel-forming protein YqfA (hemolysin III family)